MSETKSFWATLPGVLTALATVIVAITGLFTALSAVGFIGTKAPETSEAPGLTPTHEDGRVPGNSSQTPVQSPPGPSKQAPQAQRAAITVRNTSQRIAANRWAWTVYIEAGSETLSNIQCVEYTLDPSFSDPIQRVCNPANGFALQSEGWGEFNIKVRVMFRDGTEGYLTHRLDLG